MRYTQDASINHLICELQRAFPIVSRQKGLYSAQAYNLLAIILGVGVGVAGLYISLWDGNLLSIPLISQEKDPYVVAGLQNLGNNCFLNVILQALASSNFFISFLQNILISDDPVSEVKSEKIPLTVALSSLLEELRILRDEKFVLNPRKVMFAMSSYASHFNLMRQQDAAEAFLHLLSALEEEISENYMLHNISLAQIMCFPSKIYKPIREGQNECERWKQKFLGPFDGTIGSSLTCKSCSSMISMDFEFFRCLPLPPVLDRRTEIMAGCTVVDCFKHFTAVEHVENYHCGRCWHASALKYLSKNREMNEDKIKKLDCCVNLDSCDCKKIFLEEEITWTGFSYASKQLRIARSPRILCIHLQRASMNVFGEFIKLEGHISFPMFLDLFPFTQVDVGQETFEDRVQKLVKQQPNMFVPQLRSMKMKQETRMLPHINKIAHEKSSSEMLSTNMLRKSTSEPLVQQPYASASGDTKGDMVAGRGRICASDLHGPHTGSNGGSGLNNKVACVDSSNSSKQCMYRLSSVVEHYGMPGTGHYAVYRRQGSELGANSSVRPSEAATCKWFYVSDRDVSVVSEETVLAAEASLLFYEMIHTNTCSD